MNKKRIISIFLICSVVFYTEFSFASNCTGCCSTHGGVICSDGATKCADGTPLTQTCADKGCDVCLPICSYSISDTNQTITSIGGNGNIIVTASDSSCAWNVINDNSWIAVTSGTDYIGNFMDCGDIRHGLHRQCCCGLFGFGKFKFRFPDRNYDSCRKNFYCNTDRK